MIRRSFLKGVLGLCANPLALVGAAKLAESEPAIETIPGLVGYFGEETSNIHDQDLVMMLIKLNDLEEITFPIYFANEPWNDAESSGQVQANDGTLRYPDCLGG